MACHEVRRVHLVSRVDGAIAKAQVRAGETTRLLGIVREVCLAVLVGIVTDNLYRVLVGTYSTICTQSIELGLEQIVATHGNFLLFGQGGKGNIIYDTYGKVVLWFWQLQVLEHGHNLGGRGVGRAKTIASTYDKRFALVIIEGTLYIQIQRLTLSARLLGAIEHGNALYGSGECLLQEVHREWTIEVYGHHTYLLALLYHVVDSLAGSFGGGTHQDDNVLGVLCPIIVEQVILTASNL